MGSLEYPPIEARPDAPLRGGRRLVALIVLAALVRVAIIYVFRGGGFDLRLYSYFGNLVRTGMNPYLPPAAGPILPAYSDMPPLNLALFASVLALKNSLMALRFFFVIVDAAILVSIDRARWMPDDNRRQMFLFYAFNPLLLAAWVMHAEDKGILFLGFLLLAGAIRQRRSLLAPALCGLMAAYKLIGGLFAVPVLLASGRKGALRGVAIIAGIAVLGFLPYFPSSLVVLRNRALRASMETPIHASAAMFLKRLGAYEPVLLVAVLAVIIVILHALAFSRRIDPLETCILSSFALAFLGTEVGVDRLLLFSMPLLWIIRFTRSRKMMMWGISLLAAVALIWQLGPPPLLRKICGGGDTLFGTYGSLRHVAYMNLWPVTVLVFYLRDKLRGRRARERRRARSAAAPAEC